MRSVVSDKGQVTIPKGVRDRLGIRAGQVLDFEAEGGRLIATKAQTQDPVDAIYGIVRLGRPTDAFVNELRGPGPTQGKRRR